MTVKMSADAEDRVQEETEPASHDFSFSKPYIKKVDREEGQGAFGKPEPEPIPESTSPDEITVSRIEVPGIIVDEFSGKTWPVPTGALEEVRLYDSPYDFKKDPRFHYECHNLDEVPGMESQGFVKVTRKELGLSESVKLPGDQPTPLDNYYVIEGQQIAMKIPKAYGDLRLKAQKQLADNALAGTVPRKKREEDGSEKDGEFGRAAQRTFDKNGYRV